MDVMDLVDLMDVTYLPPQTEQLSAMAFPTSIAIHPYHTPKSP